MRKQDTLKLSPAIFYIDISPTFLYYGQVPNISRTLVGNTIVDHSDVVGASPVDLVHLILEILQY